MTPAERRSGGGSARHLLSLAEIERATLAALLDRAGAFLEGAIPEKPATPQVIGTLFFEDSTRTRISFIRAAQRLGFPFLSFTVAGSSVAKGESTIDTARTIRAIGATMIVVRHACAGVPVQLARDLDCPIINAGDGRRAHPTQGLIDLLATRRRLGTLEGKHLVIVGDIANSRVARSAVAGFTQFGVRITLVGPRTLVPAALATSGVQRSHDLDDVLPTADAVMMLRVQKERLAATAFPSVAEYVAGYCLTPARLTRCKPNVVVLHPGPMNRGVEIDPAVADGPNSAILEQVAAGVAVRMAVLEWCAGG